MPDHMTREAPPLRDLPFEAQTYEYARQLVSRRRFLGTTVLSGGAALVAAGFPGLSALAQQRGGHLVIGRAQGSDTLDNHKASLISSSEVQAHIYDPLAVLDPITGKVHPGLALSWSFENGNKAAVFKLRPNVKFHDGTPFNAQAVEATVKRHLDPATASGNKFLLGPIDHVKAIDDLTVVYEWKQPYVALWASFLLSYTSPHSPTAVQKHGDRYGRNPVGTGPFRFVSWDASDVIRLERNPDRTWASPIYKNPGASWIDSVEYRTIPEPSTRLAALLSGEVDLLAGAGDAVPNDKVKQLQRTRGVKIASQTALGVHAVVFALSKPPMNDPRVRRALCHVMDRQKALAFALDGGGKVATGPLGSSFLYYNPNTAKVGYGYDPAQAKRLLAEAGHGQGLELTFLGPDDSISRAIAEILQADLAAIGVKLKVDSLPTAEYGAQRRRGTYHMAYLNYSFTDADILRHLLAKGAPLNLTHHENARLDELCLGQSVEFNPNRREQMLFEIQEIAVREALWCPVVESNVVAAMRDPVTINLNAAGTLVLNDVWKKA